MLRYILVLAPSLAMSYIFVIVAALDKIASAFPDISESVVQLLSTLPSLLSIPVILISGSLCSRFRKKIIVIGALFLMLAGGLLPIVCHSEFWMLMASAVIMGIGYGGLSPLTAALIVENAANAKEEAVLLSFQGTVIGVGGILFSFLIGRLIWGEWWHIYFAYFLIVPVLAMSFLLPQGNLTALRREKLSGFWNIRMVAILVQGLMFSLFSSTYQINLAMLISQLSIGDDSLASNALSVYSVLSMLSNFAGGWLMAKFKEHSLSVFMLVTGDGILSVSLFLGVATIYLSAVAVGFIHNLRMVAGYIKTKAAVPANASTKAIFVYCDTAMVGQFLSPVVINWMSNGLGLVIERRYLLSGTAILILAAISLYLEKQPTHVQ